MAENYPGITDLLRDARYTFAAFGVVLLAALLLFVKHEPDWVRVLIPISFCYSWLCGLTAWGHAEAAYWLECKNSEAREGRYAEATKATPSPTDIASAGETDRRNYWRWKGIGAAVAFFLYVVCTVSAIGVYWHVSGKLYISAGSH